MPYKKHTAHCSTTSTLKNHSSKPELSIKKNKEDLQLNILEGHCLGDHSEQNLESYASHSSSLPTPKWFLWTSQH